MHADYNEVRATFAGHPHVTVVAIGNRRPPDTYTVTFRLSGLQPGDRGPTRREEHRVDIMLPRNYPSEPPRCAPRTPIFHPNIRSHFCLSDNWAASMSLTDVITKLGEMIQWQDVNPYSALDPVAATWAKQQSNGTFPVGDVSLGVAAVAITLRQRRPVAPPPLDRPGIVLIRRR